jgi:hypothetical protein
MHGFSCKHACEKRYKDKAKERVKPELCCKKQYGYECKKENKDRMHIFKLF